MNNSLNTAKLLYPFTIKINAQLQNRKFFSSQHKITPSPDHIEIKIALPSRKGKKRKGQNKNNMHLFQKKPNKNKQPSIGQQP